MSATDYETGKNVYELKVWIDNDYRHGIDGFTMLVVAIRSGFVNEDDYDLVKESLENAFPIRGLPREQELTFIATESGEREDVFWHKYYIVERVVEGHEHDYVQDYLNGEPFKRCQTCGLATPGRVVETPLPKVCGDPCNAFVSGVTCTLQAGHAGMHVNGYRVWGEGLAPVSDIPLP